MLGVHLIEERERIKSLFISDCHLGCKYSKGAKLLALLNKYNPENLFLVGDIIDGWRMARKAYWNDQFSFVIRRILGMVKDGSKVIYVTGNHDECFRAFSPNIFGNIEIVDEYVYETKGRKLLIIHGDIFDGFLLKFKFLYWFGNHAHSFAMWLNFIHNRIRGIFGLKYWSLSQVLKHHSKQAVCFINNFEFCICKYAKEKNCSGVVCGHIHHPEIKIIDEIDYFNCGDWMDSCTALIEYHDGRIEFDNS